MFPHCGLHFKHRPKKYAPKSKCECAKVQNCLASWAVFSSLFWVFFPQWPWRKVEYVIFLHIYRRTSHMTRPASHKEIRGLGSFCDPKNLGWGFAPDLVSPSTAENILFVLIYNVFFCSWYSSCLLSSNHFLTPHAATPHPCPLPLLQEAALPLTVPVPVPIPVPVPVPNPVPVPVPVPNPVPTLFCVQAFFSCGPPQGGGCQPPKIMYSRRYIIRSQNWFPPWPWGWGHV